MELGHIIHDHMKKGLRDEEIASPSTQIKDSGWERERKL